MSDGIDEYERILKGDLVDLQREYQQKAEPILKALTHLYSLRPAPRFYLDYLNIDDQVRKLMTDPDQSKNGKAEVPKK